MPCESEMLSLDWSLVALLSHTIEHRDVSFIVVNSKSEEEGHNTARQSATNRRYSKSVNLCVRVKKSGWFDCNGPAITRRVNRFASKDT